LVVNIVGAVLQISAYHLPQMIVGRVINGIGMGVISSVCPVFMAETSPTHIRGKLVVLGSLCNTAGFCLANWINFALFKDTGPYQWRFPLAFQLVFPLIVASFLPYAIESPRWLLLEGRDTDARSALKQLWGVEPDEENENLEDDLMSIHRAIQAEQADAVPLRDVLLFRDSSQNLRRLLLRHVPLVLPIQIMLSI
jgi:MFS family permease